MRKLTHFREREINVYIFASRIYSYLRLTIFRLLGGQSWITYFRNVVYILILSSGHMATVNPAAWDGRYNGLHSALCITEYLWGGGKYRLAQTCVKQLLIKRSNNYPL